MNSYGPMHNLLECFILNLQALFLLLSMLLTGRKILLNVFCISFSVIVLRSIKRKKGNFRLTRKFESSGLNKCQQVSLDHFYLLIVKPTTTMSNKRKPNN